MIANSLIVILIASRPVFSNNLDFCTNSTMACPPADKWAERGKSFNCPGKKRYTCLMSTGNYLREGCKFDVIIQAGRTGCPYTEQCDPKTDQPVLVLPRKYLPCPPDTTGCPARNHTGYSILDIHKYPSCQKRKSADTSYSPKEKAYIPTTQSVTAFTNNRDKPGFGVGIGICFALASTIFVIVGIIVCFIKRGKKMKGLHPITKEVTIKMDSQQQECGDIPDSHSEFVVISNETDVLLEPTQYLSGKGKAVLQPTAQETYHIKQETRQTSSPGAIIKTDSQQFLQEPMADADIFIQDFARNLFDIRTLNRPLTNDEQSNILSSAEASVQHRSNPDLIIKNECQGVQATSIEDFSDLDTESDVCIEVDLKPTTDDAFEIIKIREMEKSDHTFTSIPTTNTNSPSPYIGTISVLHTCESEQCFLQTQQFPKLEKNCE